jgi:cellulose/xylan binding protein with CBM9 domain/beta-N-acetylglucosaminidase-like protein
MGRYGGQDKLLFEEDRKKYSSTAEAQRIFTEKTYAKLKEIDKNIKLSTIPMSYWLDHSIYEKQYMQEFSKLPKDIIFVSCGAFNKKEMDYHRAITGRNAIIWDNYAGDSTPEFVEPYKIHTGREFESLTDTCMIPMHDKAMLWDIVSDFLWKGKALDPVLSARRSISTIIGAKYADLIQEIVTTVQQLKSAPITGNNSAERIASIDKLLVELDKYKNRLQDKVDKKISLQFIKEIQAIERKLELYRKEFQSRKLPVNVNFLKTPPIIDGVINDEWKAATKFSAFRKIIKNRKDTELAEHQTEVYAGWTKDKLYLAFKCYEPEIDKIKAVIKKRDEKVYHDDCVEIFFDPDKKGDYYYQIAVNSIGSIYDYYVNKEPWNGDITVKTKVSDDSWTLEMSISFASMNRHVKAGDTWNFNFCRERYAGRPEFSSWALLMKRFHEPQNFWTLKFVKQE